MRGSTCGLFLIAYTAVVAPGRAQPAPTFRTGVRLIEVDVVAKKGGDAAAGLTKDDFVLLDNGTPQKIAFFFGAGRARR